MLDIDISKQVLSAVESYDLGHKAALRCKNMWTLGLVLWLFDRDRHPIIRQPESKIFGQPGDRRANVAALNAGHAYGETAELPAGFTSTKSQRQRFHLAPIGILPEQLRWLGD